MELEILAALTSLALGAFRPLISKVIEPYLRKKYEEKPDSLSARNLAKIFSIELGPSTAIPYAERINRTLESLKKASDEMTSATHEFNDIMNEKQATISLLENKLTELSGKENELKTKIETLQQVPIEALSYFEGVLNRDGKRSAYRDYILFGAGVIVSIIVTIVLKKLGY